MTYTPQVLDSVHQLMAIEQEWDELWEHSHATMPVSRAAGIAQWYEHCGGRKRFRALCLRRDGTMVAAIPLRPRRVSKLVEVADLPEDDWSPAGDLMVDQREPCDEVLRSMVDSMAELPWTTWWFRGVSLASTAWQELAQVANEQGLQTEIRPRYDVGWIPIDDDFDTMRKRWSKNHRRNMSKLSKRLSEAGECRCELIAPASEEQAAECMVRYIEIEERSWKAESGSTIRSAGLEPFYIAQSQLVSRWNQTMFGFLELDGTTIAAQYGWLSKGVYHLFKTSFREDARSFSPGLFLEHETIREFCEQQTAQAIDCMGPLGQSISRWRPNVYQIGHLLLVQPSLVGNALMFGYRHVWPLIRSSQESAANSED